MFYLTINIGPKLSTVNCFKLFLDASMTNRNIPAWMEILAPKVLQSCIMFVSMDLFYAHVSKR